MKHLIFPLLASLYSPLGSLLSQTANGICTQNFSFSEMVHITGLHA